MLILDDQSLEEAAYHSVLPLRISDHAHIEEPLREVIICTSISGGGDYHKEMPRQLTLQRLLRDGTSFTAKYYLSDPDFEESAS